MSTDANEKLAELRKRYKEFLHWDHTTLDKKITEIAGEYSFWQTGYINSIKKRSEIETEIDELWQGKFKYYRHNFDEKLSNTEIKGFIEKDLDVIKLRGKLGNQNSLVEFFAECMKNINQLRWDIKSYIDWKTFQAGKH